jgi:hypothetical protein
MNSFRPTYTIRKHITFNYIIKKLRSTTKRGQRKNVQKRMKKEIKGYWKVI